MPQSKKRKPQQHPHDYIPHEKKRKSAVPVAMGFCMILGFGIAWFAAGSYIPGLIAGIVAGAVIGWVAGKQMDKTFKIK